MTYILSSGTYNLNSVNQSIQANKNARETFIWTLKRGFRICKKKCANTKMSGEDMLIIENCENPWMAGAQPCGRICWAAGPKPYSRPLRPSALAICALHIGVF